jgi:hypothetical protein
VKLGDASNSLGIGAEMPIEKGKSKGKWMQTI